ncbi:MAG: hypothetical protein JW779_15795 [Candidatus Thorarchaeota archaeon]|nr:hypothetical protein [Candidatus Thorarchaeota archaeon]
MGIDDRAIMLSRLIMILGILIALSSAFQYSSVWIHGEYEYGVYTVTWDDSEIVLWPTYYLCQVIGIDLVFGGILIFHTGIESSRLRIAKKLVLLIGSTIMIYSFLSGYFSYSPPIFAGVVSLLLALVTFDTTSYADRIREWFGNL